MRQVWRVLCCCTKWVRRWDVMSDWRGPGQGAGRERKIEPDVGQVPVPRLVSDVRGGMSKNDLRKGQ